MVEVVDDRILRIRNSFASASDKVKPEFVPMLAKIAKELEAGGDGAWSPAIRTTSPSFPPGFRPTSNCRPPRQTRRGTSETSAALQGRIRFEGGPTTNRWSRMILPRTERSIGAWTS